jgi:hypothetical protein
MLLRAASHVKRDLAFFRSASHNVFMAKRKKNAAAVALGKKGGKARFKKLTKEERSEFMRQVAQTRWAGHEAKRPASARKKPSQ